ncbi:hypothetical protein PWT90_11162 [Aphanocladium album]|nr:hypothetical protein PWT90_11162 [Aphanocladium album]
MPTATVPARSRAAEVAASKGWYGARRNINLALFAFVAAMVAVYAPVSGTYFLVGPEISHIGDKYYERLISRDFAYGNGSGHRGLPAEHYGTLARHSAVMMPHSVLGTIAIVVGLAQFSKTFQFKLPVVHRNLGRLYGLCSLCITASSVVFLKDTIPKKEVFSGQLFALILSMLSFGNILTMTLAVLFAWGKDIASHRELMTLNYSFMLSAPLLRVFWVFIGLPWGETKDVVNLYSAILAGPVLIGTSIFYIRSNAYPRPASRALASGTLRLAILAGSCLSSLFLATKLGTKEQWMHRPQADFWFSVPPIVFLAVAFTWKANAAHKRGDMASYTAWATYQNGLLAAPMLAVSVYNLCRDVMECPENILGLGTVVVTFVNSLFLSFVVYVVTTSKLVQRSSSHAKTA